jgi:hypothetical protein
MILNYGQPLNGIMQFSYIVEDIPASIKRFAALYGIGPWFCAGPFSPPGSIYRGMPTNLTVSLAMAFSGSIMIELITQNDQEPSVYRETIDRRGYGFHHVAMVTNNFQAEAQRYGAAGYEKAFYTEIQGGKIAYFDTSKDMPGMTELIEWTAAVENRHTRIHTASLGWDGNDPIRSMTLV